MVSSLIKSLPLIVVIMTAGVDGQQDWGVNYSPSYVCALKGSSVTISCTVTYPQSYELKEVFWTKTVFSEPPGLCSDPEKRGRVQCLSEDKHTSSLTLTAVTEADKHVYYCRFTTFRADGKWTGIPGVQLDVTDLQVETHQSVKEGDSVTLTCKSSCSLPEHTTFIWYRNTQRLTKGIVKVNQLQLRSVSRSDTGYYSCAITGHERLISPAVYLKVGWVDGLWDQGVNYSPSYVCALKGSSVTISCTATYHQSYELKEVFWTKTVFSEPPGLCSDPAKRGRVQCLSEDKHTSSLTLTTVTEADKHVYYCRFTTLRADGKWTGIPGVQLDVTDLQVETHQSVKEGDSVTLTCKSSCSLPEHTTFIWYRNTHTLPDQTVNQLQLWSVSRSDTGYYSCAIRGHERLISPAVYLKVEWVDGQQDWGVNYSPSYVCALKGSSVTISCTATFPQSYELIKAFWTKTVDGESPDLCSDPEKSGRVQCLSEDKHTSSLTLTAVTEADKHVYYCRITDYQKKIWTVVPGARLDVTDLQVETHQSVKEGDSVTLTCKSSCSLPEHTTFIWNRNTHTLPDQTVNQLQLWSVSRSDEGNYQCAVRGHERHLISPAVYLKVEYPPKSVSVSVSPSVIVEGDSVTLSCSSDSNPPALNFWSKGRTSLGSGATYSITNIESEASGNYYCSAGNKHGSQSSAPVTVNVMYKPKSVSVSVSRAVIVEGDSVTLSCNSDAKPAAEISWIKGEMIVGSGGVYSISNLSSDDSGEYKCRSRNKYGEKDSDAVKMNVMYAPRDVVVILNSSGVIVEGDSVTLSCSSDSNPPALNFSWFKEDQTSAVGSGQSFSISSFNSSSSGRFYCEAQNKYGSQRSASVSVSVKGVQRAALHTVSGLVAGLIFIIIIIIIIIIVFIKKKRRDGGAEVIRQNQEDRSGRSAETASTNDAPLYSLVSANQRDDLYANIKAKKPARSGRKPTDKDSADGEDVQYASVHHFKNKDRKKTEEHDCQSIETHHPSDANRPEDVIYSAIK